VTGGGEISVPGGFANFGFVAQSDSGGVSGQLEYQNHARNLNVHSTSITSLSVSGNSATFSGTCTKNGTPCTFTVNVQDNGEPGKGMDQFIISVSGEPTEGGTITKGNIQVHQTTAQNVGDRATDPNSAVAAGGSAPTGNSFSGRLAQLWNYVRSAFGLASPTENRPPGSPPNST
jgi:hypothetical protein